jgi:CRP-like cAMP-binding protein
MASGAQQQVVKTYGTSQLDAQQSVSGALSSKYLTFLMRVPLLKSLNLDELIFLFEFIEIKTFVDGESVFRQGDEAHEMYIIVSGRCAVCKSGGTGQPEVEVAALREGSHFGEVALVDNTVRNASVYSRGRCECIVIQRHVFEQVLGPCKNLLERSRHAYISRVSDLFSAGKGGVGLFFEEQNGKHVVRRIIAGGSAQCDAR